MESWTLTTRPQDTPTLPSPLPPRWRWLTIQSAVVSSKEERGKPSRDTSKETHTGENLKHSSHCQVLSGSNYTDPYPSFSPLLSFPSLSLSGCLFLFSHSSLYSLPLSLSLTPLPPVSFSISVLPCYWRVKECCSPTAIVTPQQTVSFNKENKARNI